MLLRDLSAKLVLVAREFGALADVIDSFAKAAFDIETTRVAKFRALARAYRVAAGGNERLIGRAEGFEEAANYLEQIEEKGGSVS